MNDMVSILIGAVLGVGGSIAYRKRVSQLVKRERQTLLRRLESMRQESAQLKEALRCAREQQEREHTDERQRMAQEEAWTAGYEAGVQHETIRRDTAQFATLFHKVGGAAMMIRQGRMEHASFGG